MPIGVEQLPDSFVVHLIRANPQNDEQSFQRRITTAVALGKQGWPRWAIDMDSNRDGEISANEFIGKPDQFAELDENSDGFISDDELE